MQTRVETLEPATALPNTLVPTAALPAAVAGIPWPVVLLNFMATLSLAFPFYTSYVALPRMMLSMSANLDQIQWVFTAYGIAQTVVMPMVGWLGSRLGTRKLFMLCLLLSTLGILGCGLAWSTGILIVFRIIQGVGAGLLSPLSVVIMFDAFPLEKRGLALGLNNTSWALGALIALPLGGYLIEAVSWRTIFFLGVPWGVVSLGLALWYLPQRPEPVSRHLDGWGFLTLTGLLVPLLYGLSQGQRHGWDAPMIQMSFLLAAASGVAFVGIELWRPNPLVELRLLRSLPFAMTCVVRFLNHVGFNAYSLLIALFLQNALEYSPLRAGLMVLPAALAVVPTSLLTGRLTDRIDPRLIFTSGLAVAGVGMYLFSTVDTWTPAFWVIVLVVVLRVGSECVFSPLTYTGLQILPSAWIRMGSGILSLMWGIGGALGNALTALLLSSRQTMHQMSAGLEPASDLGESAQVLGDLHALLHEAGDGVDGLDLKTQFMLQRHLTHETAVAAFQDCFLLTAVVYLVTMLPSLLVYVPRYRSKYWDCVP
jgi:EmrB/QacA subfamily drug resistance transporter